MRGDLDWIVMKALEKDRTRRYETANGLARDIERYLHDEPVEARPPSAGYRFRKFARRNKAALFTVGLVAAALVVGTIVSTWQAIRATRAENLADARLVTETEARQAADKARAAEAEQRKVAETERAEAEKQRAEAEKQRAGRRGELSKSQGGRGQVFYARQREQTVRRAGAGVAAQICWRRPWSSIREPSGSGAATRPSWSMWPPRICV